MIEYNCKIIHSKGIHGYKTKKNQPKVSYDKGSYHNH